MNITFNQLLIEAERPAREEIGPDERKTVCVQGLGFVGSAMAAAVANARSATGRPVFDVIGVDVTSTDGLSRVAAINSGRFPFPTTDPSLQSALLRAQEAGNIVATTRSEVYALADIVVVDVPCDVFMEENEPKAKLAPFIAAVESVGWHIQPDKLIIVETTVPPGTCEKIVAPKLKSIFTKRGYNGESVLLAHSYERVMPGPHYLDSIVNYWRVYSGHSDAAADACAAFLSQVINVSRFPLSRLKSTTASETAKVLENSFRAVNIAFVDEWSRFAEKAGVDLFEVIDAIRLRPTHVNIRQPGFGVGGYCLTKDPLLGAVASRDVLGMQAVAFPLSAISVEINAKMPLATLRRLETLLLGGFHGKRILLMGVSYRADVGDTRYSPSQVFFEEAVRRGARVIAQDPLVNHWREVGVEVMESLPILDKLGVVDAVVFAVSHAQYHDIDFVKWLGRQKPVILDANRVLSETQLRALCDMGCTYAVMGRGAE